MIVTGMASKEAESFSSTVDVCIAKREESTTKFVSAVSQGISLCLSAEWHKSSETDLIGCVLGSLRCA